MLRTHSNSLRSAAAASLVMAALLLTACGDDDGGTNDNSNDNSNHNTNQNTNQNTNTNTTGGLTIEQYCAGEAVLEQAWCDYIAQCCDTADQAASTYITIFCNYGPEDPQDCIDDINQWITDGRIVWNGTTAQACLDAQAGFVHAPPTTCDGMGSYTYLELIRDRTYRMQMPECKQALAGQANQGQECTGAIDCAVGLSCQGASAPYTCQPLSGAYGSCSFTTDCEGGLVCYDDMCGDLQGVGESCMSSSDCQQGLMCGSDGCVVPVPANGSCADTSSECVLGTYCDWGSNTCVTYGAPGQPCGSDYECTGRCEGSTCVALCGGTWF